MRRATFAAFLLLASCATSTDTAHSGPPRTEPPEVLAMSDVRPAVEPLPVVTTAPTTTAAPTTTEAVVPVTAAPPVRSSSSGVPAIIAAAFGRFGNAVVDQAIRVAECESNLNPRALNASSGASGLFQIMGLWADDYQRVTGLPYYDGRFDPHANATFAAWLYGQSGSWRHWSCRP